MRIAAELKQTEIVQLLKGYGFEGLHLTDHQGKTSTYSFTTFRRSELDRTFGQPSIAAGGKVAVYNVPNVGRLGVSPGNNLVRLIDESQRTDRQAGTGHLANVKVPPKYAKAYLQAQGNPTLRPKFCHLLFDMFNKERFDSKLDTPKFEVSEKNPKGTKKTTRGAHTCGPNFGPGTVWMASFMFNARPEFFYEVFLHELCHLAAWNVSKSTDFSHNGHGPTWQMWMKKVGLDARRYDPTDDTEYQVGPEKYKEEAERAAKYGPAVTEKELKQLEKVSHYKGEAHKVWLLTHGRLFRGDAKGKEFTGVGPNGKDFVWKYKNAQALGQNLYESK